MPLPAPPPARYIRGIEIFWDMVPRGSYLWDIPALAAVRHLDLSHSLTFFCGENGTGKSTLLEAIAVAYGYNAEGGTRNYQFSTFDDFSPLHQYLRLFKGPQALTGFFLRSETFYNMATQAEEYRGYDSKESFYRRYGGKSFHEQSHGESFFHYFSAFDGHGLYLMDEPESALSVQNQLALVRYLVSMTQAGSQFIIATHSPILLGTPGAEILSFDSGTILPVAYEDTESYKLTELFLNHRSVLLNQLLAEDEDEDGST